METSSWITKNQTNAKLKKNKQKNKTQTKNSGRVHSLTRVYFFPFKCFFSSKQFLNRLRVVWIFRSLFSSASLTYSHTENKCLCLISEDKKNKKRHCIFTSRSLGPLFSRSPHSLHTRVSHGSVFLWSDMISKLLILLLQFKYLSVCKYISLIILTRLIGSGPLRLELEASLLLSICVINYIFFTKICHVKTVFVSVFVSQYFSS